MLNNLVWRLEKGALICRIIAYQTIDNRYFNAETITIQGDINTQFETLWTKQWGFLKTEFQVVENALLPGVSI